MWTPRVWRLNPWPRCSSKIREASRTVPWRWERSGGGSDFPGRWHVADQCWPNLVKFLSSARKSNVAIFGSFGLVTIRFFWCFCDKKTNTELCKNSAGHRLQDCFWVFSPRARLIPMGCLGLELRWLHPQFKTVMGSGAFIDDFTY